MPATTIFFDLGDTLVFNSATGVSTRFDEPWTPCSCCANGRNLQYKLDTPMANLLLTMMDGGGVHIDKFGDSNGRILEPRAAVRCQSASDRCRSRATRRARSPT